MPLSLPENFFGACLSPTDSSTPVRFQSLITNSAADLQVRAFGSLAILEFVNLGRCTRELMLAPGPVAVAQWGGPDDDQLVTTVEQGVWQIQWGKESLFAIVAKWQVGYGSETRSWLVGPDANVLDAFALDVERQTNDPRDSILVFHGSCWQRSHELWKTTQQASFDDLVLARSLKEKIRGDFRDFLAARSEYEELGIAWRRGALLLGPPGNGKTHCLRALVKELGIPSLYVQSVKARYETEEANLKRVFERARQLRPCVLVLEDLDALVNAQNRSFFLNQLDGFEKNVGLIVLATTNHPERIDPAILDRPSRFDRKYHFELPELAERTTYLELWEKKLAAKTAWSSALTSSLASKTGGFSFAYLKELVVSALMHAVKANEPFPVIIERECAALASEMDTRKTRPLEQAVPPEDLVDMNGPDLSALGL